MNVSGRTVLITGGGTGVGLSLAESFLQRDNTVIVCGRRKDRLDAAKTAHPGLHVRVTDVSDDRSRRDLAGWIEKDFPALDVLVNNAGVQHLFDFRNGMDYLEKAGEEITTNLVAPIHLTALFLPLLERNGNSAVVNISSGLA
jgi:uncharacterized oxidoreductase